MQKIIPIATELSRIKQSGSKAINFTNGLPPLSIYVHVPWCVKKCPYCDFNSHKAPHDLPEDDYLKAFEAEIIQVLPSVWGRPIHTIFLGGGTPSLLSERALDKLLALLRSLFGLSAGIEITMEANPGTVEASKFKAFANSGVNRLSLGVQSFNNESLSLLGRVHDSDQAKKAIDIAQMYFDRINLDLMYALPKQTLKMSQEDLTTALSFGTEHLSIYQLTLEPNTVFAKYPPKAIPHDEIVEEMQDAILALTNSHGFEQYEVSAYAQANQYAMHNLNYWQFGDYLGLGPGAHGKISSFDKITRTVNLRSPESWINNAVKMNGSHQSEIKELASDQIPFEFMLNALRLKQGVPAALFQEYTSLPLSLMDDSIKKAIDKGLLEDDPTVLKASELGWRFLNDLQMIFLED